MTDEEKKEYRDKLVEDCMKYNHIDYDDDKDIVCLLYTSPSPRDCS